MYAEMKMLYTRANEYKDCHLPALQTTLPNLVGFIEPSQRAATVFSMMQLLMCRIQSVTEVVVPFFLGLSRTRRLCELLSMSGANFPLLEQYNPTGKLYCWRLMMPRFRIVPQSASGYLSQVTHLQG